MAALTAAANRSIVVLFSHTQSWRVANGDTIYHGSFCGLPGTSGLTSRRGYLTTYRDVATIEYAGLANAASATASVTTSNTVVGDTSLTPVPEISTEAGPIIVKRVTATGASAQSDVGKPIYLSNDNDFTMTQSVAPAVGRVIYWYSSTTVDVVLYGYLIAIVI